MDIQKSAVRRLLLEKQQLLQRDTNDVLIIIKELECVQLDPVAAAARNHDLVLFARNSHYSIGQIEPLLAEGDVFEYMANAACVIPVEDYPIFEPVRRRYRERRQPDAALEKVMDMILTRLAEEGPLPSRAFKSSNRVKGYWDTTTATTKDTTLALNILFDLGKITIAKRNGSEKFFTIPEHKIPAPYLINAEEISLEDAKEAMLNKYMRAYRVFDFEDPRFGWFKTSAKERRTIRDRLLQEDFIVPLHIPEVKKEYFILREDVLRLVELNEEQRKETTNTTVTFLPPLDNLLWRRPRLKDIFNFEYTWEIYMPASKRIYGYYAMPILFGDSLIGRMNPKLLKQEKTLVVKLLQIEEHVTIDQTLINETAASLLSFAKFHHADRIVIEQTEPDFLLQEIVF
ncbi:DNA glycosylase AlkZ-like family protein [Alteribacillus sp. HJP-4]|uniref:DNA glycosylase AlkZ-like family protein n=1 Tax=Alteribacillus sp. HJP-4 TaxID=2775394 RepID=UPI0035CD263A